MSSASNPHQGAEESEGYCPRPTQVVLPATSAERDVVLARLSKALGHPVRVAIVRQLGASNACVNDIVGELPLAQSTVSQHLKVLKEAGIVRGEMDGPRVCYCLEPGSLDLLRALIGAI